MTKFISKNLKLSVIMASYSGDNPEWLLIAGKSIFKQTRGPQELVIVLDGSVSSEHLFVVKQLSQLGTVVTIQLEKNLGPGLARHNAILASSHEIIAIMDSDDICRPERFENQLSILETGSTDVVGSWISEFELCPGDLNQLRKVPKEHKEILSFAKTRTPMNNVTAMFFKNAYIKAGGFGYMRANEDYDLYVRMLIAGARFHNVQKVLVDVRGGLSMSARRGDLSQLPHDIKMFYSMYQNRFISLSQAFFNISVRILLRALPNNIRKIFYQIFLRD